MLLFIETSVFTAEAACLWDDDEYAEFQAWLAANPEAGKVVAGTGGLRKVRWSASGRGKRGGARVIYYYANRQSQIWLFLVYAKARKGDLTKVEKDLLRKTLQGWNDG